MVRLNKFTLNSNGVSALNPENLLFAETHEWAAIQDGVATIGISANAVEALTDLVYMELPAVGDLVDVGQAFGEVESVKATSEMYSPVAGEIVEVNSSIVDSLEILNTDPYEAGWIIKVKMNGDVGVDKLLSYGNYQKQCDEAS